MQTNVLQAEIAKKSGSLEALAERVVRQPEALQEVFDVLGADRKWGRIQSAGKSRQGVGGASPPHGNN